MEHKSGALLSSPGPVELQPIILRTMNMQNHCRYSEQHDATTPYERDVSNICVVKVLHRQWSVIHPRCPHICPHSGKADCCREEIDSFAVSPVGKSRSHGSCRTGRWDEHGHSISACLAACTANIGRLRWQKVASTSLRLRCPPWTARQAKDCCIMQGSRMKHMYRLSA